MAADIDHVGIVVRDLSAAISIWEKVLGAPPTSRERLATRGVEVAMFDTGQSRVEAPLP